MSPQTIVDVCHFLRNRLSERSINGSSGVSQESLLETYVGSKKAFGEEANVPTNNFKQTHSVFTKDHPLKGDNLNEQTALSVY